MNLTKWIGRILCVSAAAALVVLGTGSLLLNASPNQIQAVVREVHYDKMFRDEPEARRYRFSVVYTFQLPDGREVEGTGVLYATGIGLGDPVTVRYLSAFPGKNALATESANPVGPVLLIFLGFVVLFVLIRSMTGRGPLPSASRETVYVPAFGSMGAAACPGCGYALPERPGFCPNCGQSAD